MGKGRGEEKEGGTFYYQEDKRGFFYIEVGAEQILFYISISIRM